MIFYSPELNTIVIIVDGDHADFKIVSDVIEGGEMFSKYAWYYVGTV